MSQSLVPQNLMPPFSVRAPLISGERLGADIVDNTGVFFTLLSQVVTPKLPRLLVWGAVTGQAAAAGAFITAQLRVGGAIIAGGQMFCSGASVPANSIALHHFRDVTPLAPVLVELRVRSNGPNNIFIRAASFPEIEGATLSILQGFAP